MLPTTSPPARYWRSSVIPPAGDSDPGRSDLVGGRLRRRSCVCPGHARRWLTTIVHPFAGGNTASRPDHLGYHGGMLALHTWTLDTTPLTEVLRIARATGWDAVELRR